MSYAPASYPDRIGDSRSDKIFNASLGSMVRLNPRFNLLGSLSYTSNSSTVPDIYQYTRLVVSAGVGYSL